MRALMNRAVNPFAKLLLRSPLHFLMSSRVLLITVTGRKSGRRYTTPVEYTRQGSLVTIVSRNDRSWWKNVSAKHQVRLQLRGRSVTGNAQLFSDDTAAIARCLQRQYKKLTAERAADMARTRVVIEITLDGA
ncbi:MAG: nitroreductase family deazaflavin-dependent oxidoreductase [Chloroflexi bacterium]|nr:nitroreductase family deazaflavin-dependent oxidoreductase [Chloroflexota bacterium]